MSARDTRFCTILKWPRASPSVMWSRIDHLPAELSGGEQQRVALARALINDPSIILADEPTGNLDADAAANVLELLFEFARESGKTVILTSHSREAAELCDRQVRIVAGRLVS